MNEKKVVVFIVEGPSDEAALGSIFKEFFSGNEVRFVVVYGDITLKDYVSENNILIKINEQIEKIKVKYRYRQDDFIKIIHIVAPHYDDKGSGGADRACPLQYTILRKRKTDPSIKK